jgi:hypothetical protein
VNLANVAKGFVVEEIKDKDTCAEYEFMRRTRNRTDRCRY